ncbi:PREDICTED: probable receptor-like serine/threonine-protein kinase At5g57670 [Nelumbo nucifera]|uniref:Protein kinase domain-containing protein n=2 Tax=Nelumbo nucifera TaxID=4432 RepID=A0A822ZTT2_NELNU|nr:PREDICTED: probable receptor-like serine/threonine-protein kinase At5g57670 [Nelumbo nucifera]XP_010266828.1 PREDICTED: probable receptor-like serine/threonine-protein kinase At5g57670 [Nelumbo nucifera]XP_010266829.1 PREDICTED: probable receptor-like serine/threonine-protein kinase At5g57670 [Nelumbo nucifera]DAD46765.1 TPA_asm: hypothetical protein HUJ06_016702 [Nelumbo nucifera]
MTASTEDAAEKKSVLVGIRIDGYSRDLLSWALVKVAEPGDRVVAVNVSRNSDPHSKDKSSLDDYLQVYKGLCDVKQVDLTGYISRGNSVRKALVREAKQCAAIAVVVGINRHHALGGWVSMAKYCAKCLPPNTAILAVHNGKVVFERGSTNQLTVGLKGDPRPSFYSVNISRLKKQPSLVDAEETEIEKPSLKDCSFSISHEWDEPPSRSSSLRVRDVPESMPGWPLLRRAVSAIPETMSDAEARKMSVVQWVMSLPNRSPPLTPKTQIGSESDKEENPSGRDNSNCVDKSHSNCLLAWEKVPHELELLIRTNSPSCRWFSHKELKNSRSQFSSEHLIGKGGCNRVYKGCLPDGKSVAIKILKSSKEAWKDFALEVDITSSLNHKHITPLIGICIEDNDLISVYNFFSKGNLEENLHGTKDGIVLSWEVRFKVAVGVAEALNYLHNDCSRPVVHRDVKSSNILLSDDLEPQLSDFGLAVWAPTTPPYYESHSDVVGTFGYLAPEYFMYGKVSDRIDVYSFGVVLLELISGRKAIGGTGTTPMGQESLVIWAKPILKTGDLEGLVDPNLEGKFDEAQMQRMVLAAGLCITRTARLRPNMSQIMKLLKGDKDVEEWAKSCGNVGTEWDNQDDEEVYPESSAESLLGLALLDVDDDDVTITSFSSVDQKDYLKGRWSRSSSFD